MPERRLAFQGIAGAYSDIAAREACPDAQRVGLLSFEDVFQAIEKAEVDVGLIPVENSIAGRVAEINALLPHTSLKIIAEHYQPVHHQLLALPGARDLRRVHSHVQALSQCRSVIQQLSLQPVCVHDTAGAAKAIAEGNDPHACAIASSLAAQIYNLQVVRANIAERGDNVTRFFLLARQAPELQVQDGDIITTLCFETGNQHGALYQALANFAENGVNLTRLESLVIDASFEHARFQIDAQGHPDYPPLQNALRALEKTVANIRILGSYRAHPYRRGGGGAPHQGKKPRKTMKPRKP